MPPPPWAWIAQSTTLQAIAGTATLIIAISAHGGGGTSNDFGLAHAYAMARVLRLADGPDEVHRQQLGQMELKKYR